MLRVAVDSGGCSGFAYQFELDNEVHDDDRIYEHNGAKVIVDEISLEVTLPPTTSVFVNSRTENTDGVHRPPF